MNTLMIKHNVASFQKWVEELEERLSRIDFDMTLLHQCELKFEMDSSNLTGALRDVVDADKQVILDDLSAIVKVVKAIIKDLTGPLEDSSYD